MGRYGVVVIVVVVIVVVGVVVVVVVTLDALLIRAFVWRKVGGRGEGGLRTRQVNQPICQLTCNALCITPIHGMQNPPKPTLHSRT